MSNEIDCNKYKMYACVLTGVECDEYCDCGECETALDQLKCDEQNNLDGVINLCIEKDLYGQIVMINAANTMCEVSHEQFEKLNHKKLKTSSTPHVYGNYVKEQYPAFALLVENTGLPRPKEVLKDHAMVGVFKYESTIYLCAPSFYD